MTENNDDLIAERDKLQAEVARLRVERDTGVPASLLSPATTENSALALAERLLAWKGSTQPAAPQPTAAAPAYSLGQTPSSSLSHLSPDETMAAWRAGRLEAIGAPAPGRRRNGEHRGR